MRSESQADCTVILLSHGFQSEYEAGMANGLARNGLKVILLGSDSTLYDRLDPSVEAVNLRGSHDPKRTRLQKAWNLLRYFFAYQWLIATRPHRAVHLIGQFSTGDALVSLVELLITRTMVKRLVLTVHNVLPHERHTLYNRQLHKLLYGLPHLLVVHTERTRKRLADQFGIAPNRVAVIEHGIDRFPDVDVVGRQRVRERLGIADDAPLALFFGNLGLYKGPDLLLDALARLPASSPWHLLIAGRCRHADLRAMITAKIEQNPMRDRIYWEEGFVADDEVPALFFAADLLVLPYRHIDQSGVLFMAMATGLPVLATDVGSFRDYVAVHAGDIIAPNDIEALASSMAGFVPSKEASRRQLAANARRYDWCLTARPLLTAYGIRDPLTAQLA